MHGGKPATWSTLRDGHKGSKNWSSRIPLDADRDESDTIYILYLDLALNQLDSDDSTDIPS